MVEEGKTAGACVASEVVLLQVKARLKTAGLPNKPGINNRMNKCLTWLQEALTRFILEKPQRAGREVTHLHGCVWHFATDVQQEFPDVMVPLFSKTWPTSAKAACPKKQAHVASSPGRPMSNMFTLWTHLAWLWTLSLK